MRETLNAGGHMPGGFKRKLNDTYMCNSDWTLSNPKFILFFSSVRNP